MDADTLGLACALADIAIYKPADLIELAREGVLNELVVTTADDLEQRAASAASVQSQVADRRAGALAQAEARAADADRRRKEAERKCSAAEERCAAAEARGRVSLRLQIHPWLRRRGTATAGTQTPILSTHQVSVSTQAPSQELAAAVAEQQRKEQQLLQESARQRAQDVCLPVLVRALEAAETAERVASKKLQDTREAREAVRFTAEKRAREAAAAAADRAAAREDRVASSAVVAAAQSELASLRAAAAALEEERARGEGLVAKAGERIAWLERAEKDLRSALGSVRQEYDTAYEEWMAALDRLWDERCVYKGALKELEDEHYL